MGGFLLVCIHFHLNDLFVIPFCELFWYENAELVLDDLQDVEIVEDGAKHTLILYNCKLPQTGEVAYSAANAKCSANLKVKGEHPRSFIYAVFHPCTTCADSV